MSDTIPQPWLTDALELLDLRRNDRVLVFSAPTTAHVAAVRRSVGAGGRTLVIEPDLEAAEQVVSAADEGVEVVGRRPNGDESFGKFDAVLACPLFTLGLEPHFWASLFSHNLRPGGRFVLDLPGEEMCAHFAECWLAAGGEAKALSKLRGPPGGELASALEAASLRNVSAAAASHLVHLENPFALAALGRDLTDADEQVVADLVADVGRRLVERLKTAGEVELVFHRSRVGGLR